MSELLNLTVQNKVPFNETRCELSLEYSWNKNDNENIRKDKEAIQGFLWHCESLGTETIRNTTSGTNNTYLEAYIHPKISQLDEIVRLLKLYGLEANKLTVPLWLPAKLLLTIFDKYSFWTIHTAHTQKIKLKIERFFA
jgi:hypothetical protein